MNDDNNLLAKLDAIFVDFIRNQSFEDLLHPKTVEHYDNVIMTSKQKLIDALRYTDVKKLYLMKNRLVSDGDAQLDEKKSDVEKVYMIPYTDLYEQTQNDEEKMKYINSMSIFYTRVYDIYNAIVSILDPVYEYVNSQGSPVQFRLSQYDKFKDDIQTKPVKMIKEFSNQSVCDMRMRIIADSVQDTKFEPKIDEICDLQSYGSASLVDLDGMKELDRLFHDVYNKNDENYTNMSETMRTLYNERLDLFYKYFTGKSSPRPEHIDSFDKISLLDFKKESKYCSVENKKKFKQVRELDSIFLKEYSTLMKSMNKSIMKRKQKLSSILDHIFKQKRGRIVINPKLNEKNLKKFNSIVADIISRLYLSCQKHYLSGLLLFEVIYKNSLNEEQAIMRIEDKKTEYDQQLETARGAYEVVSNSTRGFTPMPERKYDVSNTYKRPYEMINNVREINIMQNNAPDNNYNNQEEDEKRKVRVSFEGNGSTSMKEQTIPTDTKLQHTHVSSNTPIVSKVEIQTQSLSSGTPEQPSKQSINRNEPEDQTTQKVQTPKGPKIPVPNQIPPTVPISSEPKKPIFDLNNESISSIQSETYSNSVNVQRSDSSVEPSLPGTTTRVSIEKSKQNFKQSQQNEKHNEEPKQRPTISLKNIRNRIKKRNTSRNSSVHVIPNNQSNDKSQEQKTGTKRRRNNGKPVIESRKIVRVQEKRSMKKSDIKNDINAYASKHGVEVSKNMARFLNRLSALREPKSTLHKEGFEKLLGNVYVTVTQQSMINQRIKKSSPNRSSTSKSVKKTQETLSAEKTRHVRFLDDYFTKSFKWYDNDMKERVHNFYDTITSSTTRRDLERNASKFPTNPIKRPLTPQSSSASLEYDGNNSNFNEYINSNDNTYRGQAAENVPKLRKEMKSKNSESSRTSNHRLFILKAHENQTELLTNLMNDYKTPEGSSSRNESKMATIQQRLQQSLITAQEVQDLAQ